MTRRSLYCVVLFLVLASTAMAATPEPGQPPFDYRVSLYKTQNVTNAVGGWTEKVLLYMGNDMFPNGPGYGVGAGPGYSLQFKVVDSANREVCREVWREGAGFPTGRTYTPYTFQVVYPKLPIVGGHPFNDAKMTTFQISTVVYPERGDKDVKPSNNAASQTFPFSGGGTPSCTRLPRDPQLQH
ncbi:MAG: hypothetical protein M3Z54_07010 [Gemmatimonadota bacterium]|nr:hypothetical protein [Gemmatimonadota bacterium]